MPAVQLDDRSPREIYLESIGLVRFDPFVTPVAEQELALSAYRLPRSSVSIPEDESQRPHFFDFFSAPPLSGLPAGQSGRQALRQPRTAFVYGRPGDGKTTLRLALEADCRRDADRTLVISYPFTDDVHQPLRPEEHWTQLAEALAIDLFIQIVERFNPLHPAPSSDQIDALRSQIVMGGPRLKRLARRILEEPEPATLFGLGEFWSLVHRPVVRRVVRSPALVQLLRHSLPTVQTAKHAAGEEALMAGLRAARQWGFHTFFALIDGVDTRERNEDAMLALILPLLDTLPMWEQQRLLFKFFLPAVLHDRVSDVLAHVGQDLTSPSIESIIGPWNESSLRALLVERFRVAGSRRVGFDNLVGPDIPGSLDQILFRAALGSPRRLLQIISGLMDAHVARDHHDRLISLADWNQMRAKWTCDPPAPPSLVHP